ncbi:hypothetical protein Tco_1329364 [Tanacetum coccineum]
MDAVSIIGLWLRLPLIYILCTMTQQECHSPLLQQRSALQSINWRIYSLRRCPENDSNSFLKGWPEGMKPETLKRCFYWMISKVESYKCQLDEQWFDLTKDTLRDALQITPVDNNQGFSPPPTPDTLLDLSLVGVSKGILLDLKGQVPSDYKSFGCCQIELTSILLENGCGEEFTQSIHNFQEDKRNFGTTYLGKKESNSSPYLGRGGDTEKVSKRAKRDVLPNSKGPFPVVFRETDTGGNFKPLPEDSKKKSPAKLYIFREYSHTFEPAGHEESSSLYAELRLSGSDTESDEEMPSVVRSGAQDEGREVVISSVKHAIRAPLRALQGSPYRFDVDKVRRKIRRKVSTISPKTTHGSPPSHTLLHQRQAHPGALAQKPEPFVLLNLLLTHLRSTTHQEVSSTSTATSSSSNDSCFSEYSAWTTTDTRIKPSITTIPDDLYMDDETTADEQAYYSGEEIGHDHIPTVNLRQSWWKPLTEDRPASPEPAWTIPLSDLHVPTNNWASALKTTYVPPRELFTCSDRRTIATSLVYLKDEGDFLSRCQLRATGDRRAVRTHMRILSVVRIKVFSLFGYNYMKKIILRRVDLKEYVIAERDFKYMYPSDFEDLYLLNLQDSPRAVTFRDRYGVQDVMRLNEIPSSVMVLNNKIDERLDYESKSSESTGQIPG